MKRFTLSVLALAAVAALAAPALAAPPLPWSGTRNIGAIPGNPSFGGFVFKQDDPNTLLFFSAGQILSIPVARDSGFHVTGFSGPATLFASAPETGFGNAFLNYGPGGVLFYGASRTSIGQIKPGSTSPDKISSPTGITYSGLSSSIADLAINPYTPGTALLSYRIDPANGGIYRTNLVPDGTGTFDFDAVSLNATGSISAIDYVPTNIPYLPSQPQVWITRNNAPYGAWNTDASGFLTGFSNSFDVGPATNAVFDPLTGDFIYQVLDVTRTLRVVTTIPEPTGLASAGAVASLALLRRRR